MNISTGKLGEDYACRYLQNKGYVIIKRNLKISYYEIDIIASIKGIICFIEVKTKRSTNQYWSPENLITHQKMIDFKKGSAMYCRHNKINPLKTRLEIITVELNGDILANINHYFDII